MRLFLYLLLMGFVWLPITQATAVSDTCEKQLLDLEKSTDGIDEAVYDSCGFNDSVLVWSKWAPLAAQKNARKMLYEVCRRFPDHMYHDMYCQKAYHTNYGPSLAYQAEQLLKEEKIDEALQKAADALNAQEMTTRQEGALLGAFAVYYLKKDDHRYQSYLREASERYSPIANHISGIIAYQNAANPDKAAQTAFKYIWRAILLGCPAAEENLGLFHLARQKKLDFQAAKNKMRENMFSCDGSSEITAEEPISTEMLDCRCQTVIKQEQAVREKPFILKKTEGTRAVLETKDGETYNVAAGDNLPGQAVVSEVHKTGVVITQGDDRIILNLYKPDKCYTFCTKHHITENLTPEEMKKRIVGDSVHIKPYHLTFTPQECENIAYYAKVLLDENMSYVGQKECADQVNTTRQNLIDLLEKQPQSNEEAGTSKQKSSVDPEAIKERLKSFHESMMEKNK